MSLKSILALVCALSIGFPIWHSYAGDIISCDSFENCPDGSVPLNNALAALEARMDALEAENLILKADNEEFNRILAGVTRLNDQDNFDMDTLRFTNMNLQVVSGSGATSGTPTGTGNLIIGYNELLGENDNRSGSHMLVLGARNNYSSSGGMVAGFQNTVSNLYASISSGYQNTASGEGSIVSGGEFNTASGLNSSISGGQSNTASSDYAYMPHSPDYSALLAGVTRFNDQDNFDMDTLRFTNMNVQIVSGSGTTEGAKNGTGNLIIGYNEKRGVGNDRTGSHMLVIGKQHNYSSYGGMVVGQFNTASGLFASVSGGQNNSASSKWASVSGGTENTADGFWASVSGGSNNAASTTGASVSGGVGNTANGAYASVSGGSGNKASNLYSSVSGGALNTANGQWASVSGGRENTASANYASVSGGLNKTAGSSQCTVAGDVGTDC